MSWSPDTNFSRGKFEQEKSLFIIMILTESFHETPSQFITIIDRNFRKSNGQCSIKIAQVSWQHNDDRAIDLAAPLEILYARFNCGFSS